MKTKSPFDWIALSEQKRVFVLVLILTLTLLISLQALGSPLKTSAAPAGIVSFEFAGTIDLAREIVDSWGTKGRVFAGLNLGLDFLFLVSYTMCIGLGCVLLARSVSDHSRILHSIGMILAWGQVGAGLLDSLENYALIRVLLGTELAHWPVVARWCAIPKFLLVALGLVFILLAAVLVVTKRRTA
jgi:hypothetical protein